jgi:hypothetical protein
MGAPNASRIEILEGGFTFTHNRLSGVLSELDMRVSGSNCWTTFTRTGGLISKIEYFTNSARTIKVCEQNISRVTGVGNVSLVSEIQTLFFNQNTTEDSRVVSTLGRPNLGTDDVIVTCNGPFSTTEPVGC